MNFFSIAILLDAELDVWNEWNDKETWDVAKKNSILSSGIGIRFFNRKKILSRTC